MNEAGQNSRVDDLRRQLRALGYLDAGVDRFVLAGARSARRPWAIALLASIRIGVLAALLLGPAGAVGLAGRVPGLVTGAADALVLALYLAALFGFAVTGLALAACLLAAWAVRRSRAVGRWARTFAAAAGVLVAATCLLYLTLWWQTAHAGFGWEAPVWTAFALAVAVSISLLLGHAVIVTTLAVMVAGTGDRPAEPRVPGATLKVSAGAAALAFLGAAALLLLVAPGPQPGTAPPLTVVPSGLRLRVIALDGFDPAIVSEVSSAGRVPALSAALSGARAEIVHGDTRDPARTWTTVATGLPAEQHGVHGLETRRVTGVRGLMPDTAAARTLQDATDLLRLTRPALVTGAQRQAPTFWEVAARAGLESAVVNWWTTWPATDAAGVVLSDRSTLRLERGGTLDAEIAPAELYDRLRSLWPELRNEAGSLASTLLAGETEDREIDAVLMRSAELDAIQVLLGRAVMSPASDLVAIYLPGLDIAQHALIGRGGGLSASAVAARVDAVRRYYEYLDRLLRAELTPREQELVLVVTGPGRVGAAGTGLLTLVGQVAESGSAGRIPATDVAPTILHLLGVPISEELPGSAATALLRPEYLAKHPVRAVATYGRPAVRRPPGGEPLDQEMIERLRSLGYVR